MSGLLPGVSAPLAAVAALRAPSPPANAPQIQNERVTVWKYSWTKDSPSRIARRNGYAFGDSRFNPGNRTHTELLTREQLRIIAMELK